MRSSGRSTTNGVVADVGPGRADGVAEAERLALAHEVELGERGEAGQLLEQLPLAGAGERLLELRRPVEMVLDRALPAARDDEDVGDPGSDGLFDDVLDGRLVDQGQHLLGRGLGRRQEPGPEPGRGDHGLADRRRHGRRSTRSADHPTAAR